MPKTVEEALAIDKETGTNFWQKALGKEMHDKGESCVEKRRRSNARAAQTGKESSLIGSKEIGCHVIFDVKMDFTRKARFVAGGHTTDTPGSIT